MARPSAILLAAFAVLWLAACDPRSAVAGRWGAVAIDGVGVSSATPLRVPVPAGTYYDTLALTEGWMWKEYRLDSLTIELAEDGTFVERRVESNSSRVMRSSYVPAEYVHPAFGGELIRDEVDPTAHEVRGTWTEAADTLRLALSDEARRADVASDLADILPGMSPVIDSALDANPPSGATPRWRGTLKGDRLELIDPDGRSFVFRRPAG